MAEEKKSKIKSQLTSGKVGETLLRMTLPMIFGFLSIMLFSAIDTFFLAQLGTEHLAAITFTFPISFVVISIAIGLSTGTSAIISRAIGEGDEQKVHFLATYSLVLAVIVVTIVALTGLCIMNPLFKLMGASKTITPLIKDYLTIWFAGVGFLVIPIVSNSIIRATGNTIIPSFIMITSTIINAILDPLLIFGLAGFPRLEMQGAAISTVIAWIGTFIATIGILHFRLHFLDFSKPIIKEIVNCWKSLLRIALPAMGSQVINPITSGIITALAATFGAEAVAAYGVGSRIEPIALLTIIALSTVIAPFVGQNLGAQKIGRIKKALKYSISFSLIFEGLIFILLILSADFLSQLFSHHPSVQTKIVYYLWILPPSYGLWGVTLLISSSLNAAGKPLLATALNIARLLCLYIPLAFLGAHFWGLEGIFIGGSLANALSGLLALSIIKKTYKTA